MHEAGIEYAAASRGASMTMLIPSASCQVITVRHPSRSRREISKRRTASWKDWS